LVYLFDIDGTLLLTGGAGTRALNRLFYERYGIEGAMSSIKPGGMTDPLIIRQIFAERLAREPSVDELDVIFAEYVPHLEREVAASMRFQIMPSAVATVEHLAADARVTLSLATGNIRAAARIKLERAGLWHRFRCGGFGDDSADRAELVQRAMDRSREHCPRPLTQDEFVVVGDTPRDIQAARACGIRVIVVPTGSYDREQLARCQPDVLLDSLAELPDWHARFADQRQ
jgi:phosphoglycolate phosphatase